MSRTLFGALALGFFAVTSPRVSALAPEQAVVLTVESTLNTVDGIRVRGCLERMGLATRKTQQIWIAFGAVEPVGNGWHARASRMDCGAGQFDTAGLPAAKVFGTPYLIVDLESTTESSSTAPGFVTTTLRTRKLVGFDGKGQPTYTANVSGRRVNLSGNGETVSPLLVANLLEKEAFAISEILISLNARVPEPPVSYGSVSVTSDMAGNRIYLDGGFVGRTNERGPTTLANVRVGKRDVRVTDLSGREAASTIVVEPTRMANVTLPLLKLANRKEAELQPIGRNVESFEEYWRGRDGSVVVTVPNGEFLMGSNEGQGEANERPQRRIFISGFLIDKTEVTWRQFRKFALATGSKEPPAPLWGSGDDYPVVNVLWEEAQAFCKWVGGSLPTEAQWEKAARGTEGHQYPWGNQWDADRCNSIDGGPHRPEQVGTFVTCRSPYGVVDMLGSVWEWTSDWYADGYLSDSTLRDPTGPAQGQSRVLRGGAWMSQPNWLRTPYRSRHDPGARDVDHGFRCVQNTPK